MIETLCVLFDLPAAITELRALAGTAAFATTTVDRNFLNWSGFRTRCRVTFSPAGLAAIAAVILVGTTPAVP
jgi:hypothetical protein